MKQSLVILLFVLVVQAGFAEWVTESERQVPVVRDVDVVVVGGASAGVAAAVEAKKQGASVFLISSRPYLGEDICGTYRLWLEKGEIPDTPLAEAIFATSPPQPLHVKTVLEKALLDADIDFLFECYPTDVLLDREGKPAGIVMANRSGRQAIRAKVIIDTTPRAVVARMAGAKFTPYPSGPQEFKRIVVGGEPRKEKKVQKWELAPMRAGIKNPRNIPAIEYTLRITMKDDSFASFANAEQIARDMTWHEEQEFASEFLFQVPPDHITKDIENIFVLGGCADVLREEAEKMLRPVEYIKSGYETGKQAAAAAKKIRKPADVQVSGFSEGTRVAGDVRESLYGLRGGIKGSDAFIKSPQRSIPVLGKYDVVVVGGGTAGAPAGIAAARQGAKTLVVEYLHGLGGTSTLGMIGRYWYGNRVGFTAEIDKAVGNQHPKKKHRLDWRTEDKMEWYRNELRKVGADIWFCAMGCGAFVDGNRVKGVVVATLQGRGVVLCDVVIDATGNADIAVAAGADSRLIDAEQFAMQGTGLSSRGPSQHYNNTDWTYVSESDVMDRTRTHVVGKKKHVGRYDISPLIVSREKRSIIGDYTLTPLDVVRQRTFSDTILRARSNFDSHGYTLYPLFKLWFPARGEALYTYVPYRCLIPRGLDGILVSAIGISVHRDSLPIVRMQPDVQNQGYAAGVAAAMAVKSGQSLRDIDIKKLQGYLVQKGNLEKEVLKHKNSPRASKEEVEKAVAELGEDFATAAIILDAPKEVAVPVLREAYAKSKDSEQKLRCAQILALLGDATGSEDLQKYLAKNEWDKGWTFVGMGNHGAGYSRQDSMIIGLGEIGDKTAVPVILEKLKVLDIKSEFSHFRSCAVALEKIRDKNAVDVLAEVIQREGIGGHAMVMLKDAIEKTPPHPKDNSTREKSLRELILARSLYRCGDKDGLARSILERYANDLRGLYALHARQVLSGE